MTKRPTAQEYKQEMQDLLNKTEKLRQVINTRLYTLCVSFPDVVITHGNKAKSLVDNGKDQIKNLPFEAVINFIGVIEKYISDQHPHKQTTITF